MAEKKRLRLVLIVPRFPARVQFGSPFSVKVRVTAEDVGRCSVTLKFNKRIFEETSGKPLLRKLENGDVVEKEVLWRLRVKARSFGTLLEVTAQANGLLQTVQFFVEVAT